MKWHELRGDGIVEENDEKDRRWEGLRKEGKVEEMEPREVVVFEEVRHGSALPSAL